MAGVSARRFYQLFDGQDDLAMTLLEGDAARLLNRLRTVLAAGTGWAGVAAYFEVYLDALLDPAEDARRQYYQSHVTDAATRARVRELRDQLIAPLERALEEGRTRGELAVTDVTADARRVHNLLEGAVYAAVHAGHPEKSADVKASVLSFVARALDVHR